MELAISGKMCNREAFLHVDKGEGRLKVYVTAWYMGESLLLCIYNENAHLGAVSVSEFDHASGRNSVSTITLLGHKDDYLTREAAYLLGKHTQKPVGVICGVHVENITREEISQIMDNTKAAVEEIAARLDSGSG